MTDAGAWPRIIPQAARANLALYGALAGAVSLFGSVLLATLAGAAADGAGFADATQGLPDWDANLLDLFGLVVFAPLVETALLSALLAILGRFIRQRVWIATIAALVWGGLHGAVAPLWFFGTVWAFFVFAWSYLAWRPRSYWHAFAAAAIPHALQNSAAFVAMALAPAT
ncbi:hypothetical protein ACFFGH_01465 [Lysobacter korlensis]|uniref:CPBP family intramembrane metalloprotease n=1 Tax=Lysobacter korlensis TaxID=553636 RepID=A0ABV6RHQ3_9GAMM